MRFITPIILIGISIAMFFVVTDPMYTELSSLRAQASSYDEALGNSKSLENERDKLVTKENAIDPNNLIKIQKLLPENIDNIRLILEIEKIATPYGMTLKNVKYDTNETKTDKKTPSSGAVTGANATGTTVNTNKDYGIWNLSFSTTGTYNNFINFTKDLESNLRIVDISSIALSSGGDVKASGAQVGNSSEVYTYDFQIKTYWLKN